MLLAWQVAMLEPNATRPLDHWIGNPDAPYMSALDQDRDLRTLAGLRPTRVVD